MKVTRYPTKFRSGKWMRYKTNSESSLASLQSGCSILARKSRAFHNFKLAHNIFQEKLGQIKSLRSMAPSSILPMVRGGSTRLSLIQSTAMLGDERKIESANFI